MYIHEDICILLSKICAILFLFFYSFDSQRLYHKSVNKVVLMIIDGIRYDFFTEPEFYEHMPFVTKRINRNQSCLYRTRVNAPTVTMPRIKVHN